MNLLRVLRNLLILEKQFFSKLPDNPFYSFDILINKVVAVYDF